MREQSLPRMKRIFVSKPVGLDGWRLDTVLLVLRVLLRLLGIRRDFIGMTLYIEGVGTLNLRQGEMPENNQIAIKLWFKDWP